MKINSISIVINITFLLFLFATFLFQFEALLITRIVTIVFSICYLIVEIKKDYFAANKRVFLIFSVISILAFILSIYFDYASTNGMFNHRGFLIPVFVLTLIMIMYRDLQGKNDSST